jgi:hypothetical protein
VWLPLQFSVGLEPRLLSFVSVEELRRLRRDAENELQEPARWGTTFTLMQSWGRIQLTRGIAELRQSRGLRRV